MQFEISRNGALKKLDNFINTELPNYNFKRNFDLGPEDKSNVSCLSPYISHRLITEYEVAKIVLAKFPYQKVEKYIQEIFWRVYWKGWLELRPNVWADYLIELNQIKNEFKDNTVTIKNLKGVKGENNKTIPKKDLIDEVKKLI